MVNTQTIYRFCMSGKIKKQGLPFFIVPYLIGLCFLNCSAQQSYTYMDLKYLKENGEYIHYHVLPESKNIDISLVSAKEKFEQILKEQDGVRMSRDSLMQLGVQRNYIQGFFLLHCNSAEVYQLKNGIFLVNQYLTNKPNPYFLAASIDDILLVFEYVLITREEIDSAKHTFIQSSIYSDDAIHKFLLNTDLIVDEQKSSDSERLYKDKNGQYVVVRYSKKRSNQLNASPSKQDARGLKGMPNDEFYHSAAIYQSMEDIILLGVFERELDDIDEENFADYASYIFLTDDEKIPVKILNAQRESFLAGSTGERLTGLDESGEEFDVYKGKGTIVYLRYNDHLFIEFKTTQDLSAYARTVEVPDFQKLSLELTDPMLNSAEAVASLPSTVLPVLTAGLLKRFYSGWIKI